jgi:hypothetical protein
VYFIYLHRAFITWQLPPAVFDSIKDLSELALEICTFIVICQCGCIQTQRSLGCLLLLTCLGHVSHRDIIRKRWRENVDHNDCMIIPHGRGKINSVVDVACADIRQDRYADTNVVQPSFVPA